MTFLQLQYFQTVAQAGSIVSAAELLNVSPASLSKTIHQLETELGVELFSREGRRIVLNQAGSIFLECTDGILDAMASTRLELSSPPNAIRRMLRIRLDTLLGEPGRTAVELKAARPDLMLDFMPPARTQSAYDLRFFSTSNELASSCVEHICTERWVAALGASHPLARRRDIGFRELVGTPFILFQGDGHEEAFHEMCADANVRLQVGLAFGANAHGGLQRAVSEGLGFSIVPERVWKAESRPDPVALVPFSDIVRQRHIYCAYPANRPVSEEARFVIDYVREKLNRA